MHQLLGMGDLLERGMEGKQVEGMRGIGMDPAHLVEVVQADALDIALLEASQDLHLQGFAIA